MKRIRILAISAIVLAGALIGYRLYNKPVATAADKRSDVSVDAGSLYTAFKSDETAAGAAYNDKTIEVTGTVRAVETGTPVNVLLDPGTPDGSILCEFDPANAPAWASGQQVRVKGICAGLNGLPGMEDVLLQRCAAVE